MRSFQKCACRQLLSRPEPRAAAARAPTPENLQGCPPKRAAAFWRAASRNIERIVLERCPFGADPSTCYSDGSESDRSYLQAAGPRNYGQYRQTAILRRWE